MANEPTVFVVDDDDDVRKSLGRSLSKRGYAFTAFASAEAFLDAYQPQWRGCLILDVRMPEMSGLDLQQALLDRRCTIPIIFITGHGDIAMSVRAIRRGAIEFLEKPYRLEVLMERVAEAMAQSAEQEAEAAQVMAIQQRYNSLTDREREVMAQFLADTAKTSNKEIARALNISHRTIADHRARIMAKMQAGSLTELVLMVKRCNL